MAQAGNTPASGQVSGALEHRTVQTNGITIHYAEQGQGKLVLLVHGFPESWYSWRHQIEPLVKAGYRVVVPDMRGYGKTSKPTNPSDYSVNLLVGDLVGLVQALGEKEAILIGHDWGGTVSWYAALMRPDVFKTVAVMGAPYSPPMYLPKGLRLTDAISAQAGGQANYRVAFSDAKDIDEQLNRDAAGTLRAMLYTFSGDVVTDKVRTQGWSGSYPKDQTFVAQLNVPEKLPSWLSEEDLAIYTQDLGDTGFTTGLNYYRNLNQLPTILSPFIGKKIEQPALYLYGEHDLISGNTEAALQSLRANVTGLKDIIKIPGKGHWLQQEAPAEVNAALLDFLNKYAAK